MDGFHYAVNFAVDFAVREAQYLVSSPLQIMVANGIALAVLVVTVLMTVDLHDEERLAALEIDDVRPQRRLPAEVMSDDA